MLTAHLKNTQKDFSQCLKDSGFTLIELLIVITIIGALAVTVFVALNPVKRVKDAHDARRAADVESQLTAIHEYVVDKGGNLPSSISTLAVGQYVIGTAASCTACNQYTGAGSLQATNYTLPSSGATFATSCGGASAGTVVSNATLTSDLTSYLKTLPTDPIYNGNGTTWGSTGYSISIAAGNIITVTACFPEDSATVISQSR